MDIILFTGIAIFALSSIVFFLQSKADFNAAFFVSFITLASYVVMWQGGFAMETAGGEEVHWSRWVAYALSCTLLMYTIGKKLDFSPKKLAQLLYLTAFVMLTGALAAVFSDLYMLVMFGISSVAYLMLVPPILKHKDSGQINYFILFGWSLFPVVFILSPAGFAVINTMLAFALYLGLDIFTKIAFYFFIDEE